MSLWIVRSKLDYRKTVDIEVLVLRGWVGGRAVVVCVWWGGQSTCTTICDTSMAARAGFSHPLELITSTIA